MGWDAMIDLKLKKEARFKNIENDLLAMFHTSATGKANKMFRFAKVDSSFAAFLPYLKDGAVKLYLYYAFVANNETGESWHSIDTISKRLGATERSISNWNNQLEELGLIYRTSNGKKSKATFLLPLTGFAVQMSLRQIEQILGELDLYSANPYTRVFGRVRSVTKLYIKGETPEKVREVLCVHLQRRSTVNTIELNRVDTFVYHVTATADKALAEKLLAFESDEKVALLDGEQTLKLGKQPIDHIQRFYINDTFEINDTAVYEIMNQLEDDEDVIDFARITV